MSAATLRLMAWGTFIVVVLFILVDGFVLHAGQRYDGIGLLLTFILPPIGLACTYITSKINNSGSYMALYVMNILALLSFPL